MAIANLHDLYIHELEKAYAAERYAGDALAGLATTATAVAVPAAEHAMTRARERLKRLDLVFKLAGRQPGPTSCQAMDATFREAEELLGSVEGRDTRIAALAAATQLVRHGLLARYITLASWATALGKADEGKLLLATVEEERTASLPAINTAGTRSDKAEAKDAGMGDRLTALLGRKE